MSNSDSNGAALSDDSDDGFDFDFGGNDLPVSIEDLSGDLAAGLTSDPDTSREGAPAGTQEEIKVVTPEDKTAVVPPAPKVETPKAPETPAAPTPAPAQTAPQEDFTQYVARNRGQIVNELAKNHFKVGDAELGLLDTDPAQFFSNFRAQMYVDTLLAQSMIMKEALPRIIDAHQSIRSNEKQSESEFYEKFPDLNKPEYVESLLALGDGIKRANPGITRDQLMQKLGVTARAYMGLPTPQAAPPKPRGFQPARGRAAAPTGQAAQNPQMGQMENIFSMMQQDVD